MRQVQRAAEHLRQLRRPIHSYDVVDAVGVLDDLAPVLLVIVLTGHCYGVANLLLLRGLTDLYGEPPFRRAS